MPSASKLSSKEQVGCERGRSSSTPTTRARMPFFNRCSFDSSAPAFLVLLRAASPPIAHREHAGDLPQAPSRACGARPGPPREARRANDDGKKAAGLSAAAAAAFFDRVPLNSPVLFSLPLQTHSNSTMPSSASSSTRTTRPSSSTPTTSARGSSWTSAG